MQDAGTAQRLRGKVALVTGAGGTNSIGRSIALAAGGRRRGGRGARRLRRESSPWWSTTYVAAGGKALALACDLTQLDQCEAAAAALVAAHGRIDILVNNAAAFTAPGSSHTSASFRDWSVEEWDHIIDVNLRGMWFMLRAVVPYMEEAGLRQGGERHLLHRCGKLPDPRALHLQQGRGDRAHSGHGA